MIVPGHRIRWKKLQRECEGYLELGMPEHALATLARLGDPAGFGAHTLYLWGEALRTLERCEEAILPLARAAEAAPEDIHVRLALGWCYKRTGQLGLAIESLEAALGTEPDEALLHYNLACYWSLAGNKRHTLAYLSRSLAIEPAYCELIEDEPDFDPFRSDPEFQALCHGAWSGDRL